MAKKRIAFMVCLAIAFLVACAPSTQAIQTAYAETQAAVPTSTFISVPPTNTSTEMLTKTPTIKITETPTEVPSRTLSPALDLLSLQENLKEFLVKESDLPPMANYTFYFHLPLFVSNGNISQSMGGDANDYLAETGRINGWEVNVDFEGDPNLAIAPFSLYNQVALFNTDEGAQLAITKYSDRYVTEYGFTEDISPFKNGDTNRSFYLRFQEQTNSSQYSLKYIIVFSYRNILETLQESGMERPIDPIFMADIAQRLLVRLQAYLPVTP
jgi:hypothetical protein